MTSDPDQLRRDIERTQHNLSTDVDRLTEKVTPSRIAGRRINRVRQTVRGVRDRVMGSASDGVTTARTQLGDTTNTVADRVSSAASSATDAVQRTPQAVRRETQGNPLAAGLIAFGAGWLVSTLAPATRPETRLAEQAEEFARDHAEPVKEQLQEAATDLKENLRDPAKQATDSIRTTATDATTTVTDEARSAASDVRDRTGDTRQSTRP